MAGQMGKRTSLLDRYVAFFTRDIWVLQMSALSFGHRILVWMVRVVSIVIRGFLHDNCALRASALTYATLLSVVPLLAFTFALVKGFRGDLTPIQNWIVDKLALGNQELGNRIFSYVSNVNATTLGLPALGILLISIVSVMGNIEFSFNQIWGVQKARSLWRRFADYLSILVVSPLLILAGVGITGTLQSNQVVSYLMQYAIFQTAFWTILKIVSWLLPCLGFIFLYIFMPNTRVKFKAALVGGLIAGVVWQLALWFYVSLQVGMVNNTRLYGALASVVVNLVWVYVSWLIVLLGAEISFAVQNVRTYGLEDQARSLSWSFQELVALNILERICRRFLEGGPPVLPAELSTGLHVSIRLVNQLLEKMATGGLLVATVREGFPYQPAQDLSRMTLRRILESLRNSGESGAVGPELERSPLVTAIHQRLEKAFSETGGNLTMEELIGGE